MASPFSRAQSAITSWKDLEFESSTGQGLPATMEVLGDSFRIVGHFEKIQLDV
jgi:hypothetical protein